MLKDLMESLKQGTEQIELRRSMAEDALSAFGTAESMQVGVGKLPSNKGGRRVGGSNIPAGRLGAFIKAISAQESGGNYGVRNSSSGAMGRYQIMPGNITGPGGWDKEVLGRNVSVRQFMNSPKLQDAIAHGKLKQYYNQFGPAGAAKAWYAGPGNAHLNSDRPQSGGPSINDYAASILRRMKRYR